MLYLTSRRLRRAVSLASLHKQFSVDVMVPTLGGNSECVAHMWFEMGKKSFAQLLYTPKAYAVHTF